MATATNGINNAEKQAEKIISELTKSTLVELPGTVVDDFKKLFATSRDTLKEKALGIDVTFDEQFIVDFVKKHVRSAVKQKEKAIRSAKLQRAGEYMANGMTKDEAYRKAGLVAKK